MNDNILSCWGILAWILATVALHRLWNMESITAKPRAWANKVPGVRAVAGCPSCNAVWLGILGWMLWFPGHVPPLWATIARDVLVAYLACVSYVAWLWSVQPRQGMTVPVKMVEKPKPETKPETKQESTPIPCDSVTEVDSRKVRCLSEHGHTGVHRGYSGNTYVEWTAVSSITNK